MAINIRAIAEGELLDQIEDVQEEDEYEELKYLTWLMRRTYPGRENIVVQLIRDDVVEAENHVNPTPAMI